MKFGFWWDVELFGHNFTIFFDKIEISKSFDRSVVIKKESFATKKLDIFGDLQCFEEDVDKLDGHEAARTLGEIDASYIVPTQNLFENRR